MIASAWADSTKSKYARGWATWSDWCKKYPESPARPASPFYIALFLNELTIADSKKGKIETAFLGIRWGHIVMGLDSPTVHPFVKLAFEGAKRISSRNTTKTRKEPMDLTVLNLALSKFGSSSNLLQQRFLVVCFLGFAGFFRISELLSVQMKHIHFDLEHMTVTLEESKTDKLREGEIVHVARSFTPNCPVTITEKYIQDTRLAENPQNFLISRLSKTRFGHKAIGHKPLSYSTVRDSFKEHLSIILQDDSVVSTLGLHSLRSGGASAAASHGVSDRLIGKHGRWSSETSRDGYIKDCKRVRLSVTKNLGF